MQITINILKRENDMSKLAIITGGIKGIGAAISIALKCQ